MRSSSRYVSFDLFRAKSNNIHRLAHLQIFQPTDHVTEAEALKTTQELVKTIYEESPADDSDIQGLARDACEECIGILKEPEKSQAKYAIKVLCAFMSTTRTFDFQSIGMTDCSCGTNDRSLRYNSLRIALHPLASRAAPPQTLQHARRAVDASCHPSATVRGDRGKQGLNFDLTGRQ